MTRSGRVRAVLLDAMGTLLRLEAPWPALVRGLRERHGVEVSVAEAEAATRAEMSYYRAHHDEGSDPATLGELRLRCAAVLRDELPSAAAAIPPAELLPTLMDALRFEPFDDAVPALRALRDAGVRLVVVSNWDCSLPEVLDRLQLSPLLDGILTSAQAGASKPEPSIFAQGLQLAGAQPEQALHVGDSVDHDVAGALAAGVTPVLLRRDPSDRAPAGVTAISSLRELPQLAA